jgi:hypothetical protein
VRGLKSADTAFRSNSRVQQRMSSCRKQKSRAPKRGVWLMRGAQPATSAGARLFAGSPIPALLPSSMERYRDQKTRIVISSEQVANAQFVNERTFLPEGGLWRHAQYKLVWGVCCRDSLCAAISWNCGYSRQCLGRTFLAPKWNGPLGRAMKKGRCNKRFVQSAHFCDWRPLRFVS